ncbi:S-layer homology domain-containing protein [Paenibacillus sp. 1P07SE]|uniref:S-layer homology domain-containing protein n=1 Tax=Paenibacillus sp. 1P07SE TaxID=3132209 RepID=UPI0039A42CD5
MPQAEAPYRPIEELAARGIIHGTAEDTFTLHALVKRADFVLMLMRLLEPAGEAGEPFMDDPDT